jgi:subtilisin family serine protease
VNIKKLIALIPILSASSAFAGDFVTAGGIPIENRYIVVMNSQKNPREHVKSYMLRLSQYHGTRLKRFMTKALNGGVMEMTEAQARRMAKDPSIGFVEQDSVIQLVVPNVTATNTQFPVSSWGLDRIDQNYLPLNSFYNYSSIGLGVTAYVIDSGINITHSEFERRASIGIDTVGDGRNGLDCNGHGTHVAGTIGGANYGVAKGVNLVGVRVLDCNGSGALSSVIAGIDWVTANAVKPAVVNLSLGGVASRALDNAVNNSINNNITYAVAAGNSGANACNYSPARVLNAITVGAVSYYDQRPSWSNYGSCLDIFAPGVSITSSWINSDYASATISGTSMASPHVAGAAALYLQTNPAATPSIVSAALKTMATPNVVFNAGSRSTKSLLFLNI